MSLASLETFPIVYRPLPMKRQSNRPTELIASLVQSCTCGEPGIVHVMGLPGHVGVGGVGGGVGGLVAGGGEGDGGGGEGGGGGGEVDGGGGEGDGGSGEGSDGGKEGGGLTAYVERIAVSRT